MRRPGRWPVAGAREALPSGGASARAPPVGQDRPCRLLQDLSPEGRGLAHPVLRESGQLGRGGW
jgi:hypothetical protein